MERLETLIKKFDDLFIERDLLDRRYSENRSTKEEILTAVGGGKCSLDDAKTMRKLSDAQLQLDLCAARAEGLERALKNTEKEIRDEWRSQAKLLRQWYKAKRAAMELQLQKALEPFCEPGTTRKPHKLAEELSRELHVFQPKGAHQRP